ncbi:MAG TPA: ABC transporter ATP-binding protein [Actinomycetota bacterium]|nr:ABC transporter ATP-binding protein [Actinomycetota bacterium]
MSAIEIRNVSVRIMHAEIVTGVSLDVASGEWLALIGPNGAGKTTLLRTIAGLTPFQGEVLLDGNDVTRMSAKQRARTVALVPQRPVLPPPMTVFEYVLLGRTPYIRYFDTEQASDLVVARTALDRLDIRDFADRQLGSLSGGEQQRVVLARAIAQQAPILLLDEGTSALDIGSQQQVLELVEELRLTDGFTVVSAMHDLTLAGQFAHTLALMSGGRLVTTGDAARVLNVELIREHYGAEVRVTQDGDDIVVSPVRAARVRR